MCQRRNPRMKMEGGSPQPSYQLPSTSPILTIASIQAGLLKRRREVSIGLDSSHPLFLTKENCLLVGRWFGKLGTGDDKKWNAGHESEGHSDGKDKTIMR